MDADAPMDDISPCNLCSDDCSEDFIQCGQCANRIHLGCASGWVANKFRNALVIESQRYGEVCEETLGQAAAAFIAEGVKCTTCNQEKTIDVVKVVAHYAGSDGCKTFFATRHVRAQQLKAAREEPASPEVIARLQQGFEAEDFKHAACFLLRLYMYGHTGPSSLTALARKPEVTGALTLQAFRDFLFPSQADSNLHSCLPEIPSRAAKLMGAVLKATCEDPSQPEGGPDRMQIFGPSCFGPECSLLTNLYVSGFYVQQTGLPMMPGQKDAYSFRRVLRQDANHLDLVTFSPLPQRQCLKVVRHDWGSLAPFFQTWVDARHVTVVDIKKDVFAPFGLDASGSVFNTFAGLPFADEALAFMQSSFEIDEPGSVTLEELERIVVNDTAHIDGLDTGAIRDCNKSALQVWLLHVSVCDRRLAFTVHLLGCLAHLVQRPGVPLRIVPVLVGKYGAEFKSALLECVMRVFGAGNVKVGSGDYQHSAFAYDADALVQIIDDASVQSQSAVDTLKRDTTLSTRKLHRKYEAPRDVDNRMTTLISTNWEQPGMLIDRRFFVVMCGQALAYGIDRDATEEARVRAITDAGAPLMDSSDGAIMLHGFLLALDLDGFDPTAFPLAACKELALDAKRVRIAEAELAHAAKKRKVDEAVRLLKTGKLEKYDPVLLTLIHACFTDGGSRGLAEGQQYRAQTFVELLEDAEEKYGGLFDLTARVPSGNVGMGRRMSQLLGGMWTKKKGVKWNKGNVETVLFRDWGYDVTDAGKWSKVFDAEDDEE